MKRFLKIGGFFVALMMVAAMGYAQMLIVGSETGLQGQTFEIPVVFTNDDNNVVEMNFDVNFEPALINITGAIAGPALGPQSFSTSEPSPGVRHIIITPPITQPIPLIPDREIAILTVNIVGASGEAPLVLANASMRDAAGGVVIPIGLIKGLVTITPTPRTVTFTAGAGGTLTGTTTQTVNDGNDCTPVTANPKSGYHFTGWTGDYTGDDNPLTITNVISDMNIAANFAVTVVGGPADGATLSSDKGTFDGTPTSISAPEGAPNFTYGLLSFTINVPSGDTVAVEVTMPGNIPAQSIYYKYQNGQFSQYNNVTGLNDGDQTFTITLTDGEIGDEDGLVNGIIVEPGGPAGPGPGPATVPTLNEWGMIILVGSFFILGLYILRRRGTHCAGA